MSTLCILVDFSIHIDTISMGLPILYFMGSQIQVSKLWCICAFNVVLVLVNCADSDEMQHDAAFHLGLHCLQKYMFRRFQFTNG